MARLIRTVAGLVALVIAIGILLFVLSANPNNGIVSAVHDAANWLVGPFHNVFSVKNQKLNLGLNWGLAALVYLLLGALIASLAVRSVAGGRRFGRLRSTA